MTPELNFISKFNSNDTSGGTFGGPDAIFIGPQGNIWVSENLGNVEKFGFSIPPVANDDFVITAFNTQLEIDVLANDTDADGDPLTIISVNLNTPNGAAGVFTLANKIDYFPDIGFVGDDTFDYIISDGNGGNDTGSITVTVNAGTVPTIDTDFLFTFGTNGVGPGEFDNPNGVTTISDGSIYVLDTLNNRIQVFDAFGIFKDSFDSIGLASGTNIVSDSNDNIWIADRTNHRILQISANGTIL